MKNTIATCALIACLIALSNPQALSQKNSDSHKDFYIEGAITVAKILKNSLGDIWPHKWVVIKYADGYCIFNRFRSKRTMEDVVNHSEGKGDCDWWPWPEGSKHVCLDSKSNAKEIAKKHGKIVDIQWIDHPTKKCGD